MWSPSRNGIPLSESAARSVPSHRCAAGANCFLSRENRRGRMMNNATDELKEALGMGISRRTMLRRMGYGMAGAALAPTLFETVLAADKKAALAGASLSDFTPEPVWQYTPPASYTIVSCVFLSGAVLVTAQDAKNNNSGLIYSIDSQTMEVR